MKFAHTLLSILVVILAVVVSQSEGRTDVKRKNCDGIMCGVVKCTGGWVERQEPEECCPGCYKELNKGEECGKRTDTICAEGLNCVDNICN